MTAPTPGPAWPPPPPHAAPAIDRRPRSRWPRIAESVAFAAGVVGIIGALLPAFAGQSVGDPDTAVFWIGFALGAAGSAAAISIGATARSRSATSRDATSMSIVAIVLGGIGLFLTLALFLSG